MGPLPAEALRFILIRPGEMQCHACLERLVSKGPTHPDQCYLPCPCQQPRASSHAEYSPFSVTLGISSLPPFLKKSRKTDTVAN